MEKQMNCKETKEQRSKNVRGREMKGYRRQIKRKEGQNRQEKDRKTAGLEEKEWVGC